MSAIFSTAPSACASTLFCADWIASVAPLCSSKFGQSSQTSCVGEKFGILGASCDTNVSRLKPELDNASPKLSVIDDNLDW